MDFDNLFHRLLQLKVAVIGDVMLDTYWWGMVDRISPEAPVPVVVVSKKEQRIGGAGNVALNARALAANVSLISVLGKDDEGEQLVKLLQQNHINTNYMVQSEKRITTNKIRIISRNQQMMRLDAELATDLEKKDEENLLFAFENYMAAEEPDVVILEDYNKGVLTDCVITAIIKLCKKHNVIVTVDPKRKNFFSYKEVDVFKPNLKEALESLNLLKESISLNMLRDIHILLEEKLSHHISLITLSEKGIFFQDENQGGVIPTHIRNVSDVSGAGDTVIAVAALVYTATKDIKLMTEMANIAGGMVCEEVGTVAIDKKKLLEECKHLMT